MLQPRGTERSLPLFTVLCKFKDYLVEKYTACCKFQKFPLSLFARVMGDDTKVLYRLQNDSLKTKCPGKMSCIQARYL